MLRSAHGNGAAALVRVETAPPDELPAINADDTRVGAAILNARGRPFERGNKAAAGRRPALASSAGMPLSAKDPDYQRCLAWARRYRARRIRELTIQGGGELSAGVAGLITSAAIDLATSRYMAVLAANGDSDAALKASKLAQSARQLELTALEIAAREAAARPKADPIAAFLAAGNDT